MNQEGNFQIPISFQVNQNTVARLEEISRADHQQQQFHECRICLMEDNHLISPCICKGTIAFVHQSCLKAWILKRSTKQRCINCQLCNYEYQYKKMIYSKCSCEHMVQKLKEQPVKSVMFLTLYLLLFLGTLCSIVVLIEAESDQQLQKKIYFQPIMKIVYWIALLVCFVVLALGLIGFINDYCFQSDVQIELQTRQQGICNKNTVKKVVVKTISGF